MDWLDVLPVQGTPKSLLQHHSRTGGTSGKESACQCRRHGRHRFDPWVGKIPWRRKWQPILVFLLGKPQGQRSLAGYSLWSHKESDMTEHACTHCISCTVQVLIYCILIILQIEMFPDFNQFSLVLILACELSRNVLLNFWPFSR